MGNGNDGYIQSPRVLTEMVWFAGTDPVKKGQGFCYDTDYGVAAEVDGSRCNRVEKPDGSNNNRFAGVAARDYSANAGGPNGRLIEIYMPGSVCDIYVGVATVANTGVVTCAADSTNSGVFMKAGLAGRGSAVPLQTVSAGNYCQALLLDGQESGLVEYITPPAVGHATEPVFTVMTGGVTFLEGVVTIATANAKATLANGEHYGQKKVFVCTGTYTTSDAEIELATAGRQTGGTALVSASFDAAAELLSLEWNGFWQEMASNGVTLAAT